MNQLENPAMIGALCEAARAGVSIDLIVRGFCCLKPGVRGWSENIRVTSIIGRFLEHPRIFYFASGSEDPWLASSSSAQRTGCIATCRAELKQ